MDLQLWAFAPGGSEPTILPQPIKVDASMVLSDVGSMTITYPLGAPGVEILDGYCDVELRYWDGAGWVCPVQGRFLVVDRQTDPVQEAVMPTRTYTLVSWSWLLSGVLQSRTDILDSSGNREFINQSPAEVVATLIAEALTAGFCDAFTVQNLAATGGWAPSYAPGKAVIDILGESRDQGFLEWLIVPDAEGCGRKLVLYDAVGSDLSTGDDPVTLRIGRDLVQAPSKVSMRDLAPSVLVAGDEQHYLELTNPGADLPYGFMQTYVSAAGITDLGALQTVAQARLDKGATVRAELTRQVVFETAEYLPLIDYNLGDTILAPDDQGQLAALRVRQITLTFDGNRWGGNLVLGDRFSERTLAMDRKIRQLTAPSVWGAGRNPALPAPPIMDNTTPPVSSALTATSKLTMVTLTWNGKDENGQPVAAGFDHAEAERDTSGSFPNPVNVGTFGAAGVLSDGPFNIGQTYYYRLVIVNAAGVRAAASAAVSVTVVGVKGPDLEANSITTNKLVTGFLDFMSAEGLSLTSTTINGVDITGSSTITGALFQTASSGTRLILSNSAANGSPGLGFYDSVYGTTGFMRMSSGSVNITSPQGAFTSGVMALSENGFSVTVRGGTVLSLPSPNSGGNAVINSGGGLSVNGSAVVTGSVVRPGDSPSFGTVSCSTLSTTFLSNPSAGTGDPLHRSSSNGQLLKNTSSRRYKAYITDLTKRERVLDLRPVFYKYKTETDQIRRIGLIAEEVNEILPELVTLDADGLPDGVQYQAIGVALLPIVKELWTDYKARSAA